MAAPELVEEGRAAYERRAWGRACRLLASADEAGPLAGDDLSRLAVAAYLTGDEDTATAAYGRAHAAFLEEHAVRRSARSAFWLGILLLQRGQHAEAGGWFARAQRTLQAAGFDAPEHGMLLVPAALRALMTGDTTGAYAGFEDVARVAERFEDPDLVAMACLGQGQTLVELGDAARGVSLLDEAMVAVTSGEVSPIMVGIVYCGVIITCRKVFDLRRAQEWTAALSRWCDTQEDLKPYRGQCLVHRSEILQLRGDWDAALTEIQSACRHLARAPGDPVMGMAQYQLGELHRLRGGFDRAEACYREASGFGHPVQPGLALLRLAQGRADDAVATIRRVVAERHDRVRRSQVLAAQVEIMLATGDTDTAREAAEELGAIAESFASSWLRAIAASARGAVLLAVDEAPAACTVLRDAIDAWHDLDAPYDLARARLLLARACLALGDRDTADLELAAARQSFERLRATPALAEVRAVLAGTVAPPGGLTPREVEVLRLVAAGHTNRQIAEALVISEKTVARHVSNIFTKTGVASRASATAWAYEHDLS
jgi:DNA-binding NarL/FixJ family response regulator